MEKRDPASLQKYKEILAKRESSNNYKAKNTLGYIGKYQFGKDALVDTGYKDKKGNWTGKDGIKREEDFLNSPEIQEKAMDDHIKLSRKYLKNKGATDYIGKDFNGRKVSESGLVGAAHLVGAGGVSKMLKTGEVPTDAYGTKAVEYLDLLNNIPLKDEKEMDKLKKLEDLKNKLNGLGSAPKVEVESAKDYDDGGLMSKEPDKIEKLIEDYRREKEEYNKRQSSADNMSALSSIASTFDKYSPNSVGLKAQQFDAGPAPSLNETINIAKLQGLGKDPNMTPYQKESLDLRNKELISKNKRLDKKQKKEEGLTEGQKAVDKDYAKEYNKFTATGMNNASNTIAKLEKLQAEVAADTGFGEAGGTRFPIPDVFRSRLAIERRDDARNFANKTLKELFGGQLSDAEREAAAREFWNDELDNKSNAIRIQGKIKELKDNLKMQTKKAQYYEKNKSLSGFASVVGEKKTMPVTVKRKTKDGRTALFDAETKEFIKYED